MVTKRMLCDACGKAGYCKQKADFERLDDALGYLRMEIRGTVEQLVEWATPCWYRKPDEESPEG